MTLKVMSARSGSPHCVTEIAVTDHESGGRTARFRRADQGIIGFTREIQCRRKGKIAGRRGFLRDCEIDGRL